MRSMPVHVMDVVADQGVHLPRLRRNDEHDLVPVFAHTEPEGRARPAVKPDDEARANAFGKDRKAA